jgi:hypothetical protein
MKRTFLTPIRVASVIPRFQHRGMVEACGR